MKRFKLFAVLTAIILTFSAAAQDKVGGNEPSGQFYSSSPNGSTSNPMQTTTQPQQQEFSVEKQNLLNQLRAARLNNDLVMAAQIQNMLNDIDGIVPYTPVYNPALDPIKEKFQTMPTKSPYSYEGDYQVTSIQSGGDWAVATASSNRTTTIFAAVTEYVSGGSDLVKVYASYNGGATWVLKFTYSGFAAGVDCRAGELDIEPIINGTDTLVYCAVGIDYNSHAWSTMIIANIGTASGSGATWSFGGYLSANVNYYNPKVTSDNTNYTGATYVYMTSSFDSAGTTRYTTRFLVVTSPFTLSPVFNYRQPNAPNGFWWQSNGLTPTAYLHQDICYYNAAGTDRIYTVYNHSGAATNQNIYIAWSNDYGVTVGAGNSLTLAESANIQGAICATNGGTSQSVLIGYRRFFSPDWDYRVQYSPSGGVTSGTFTANYIEFTGDTTLLVNMQGIDLGNGRFVTGHARNGGEHYYRSFNANSMGTPFQTNSITGDVSFGGCRAGYWNSQNADSCVVVWSGSLGANAYCSRLICSTVGVQGNGNEIPELFSLSQNYPNPFNPVTNIKFSIPTGGNVKLTVFDITGKEVAVLVNQNMNAGNYTADFDASQLSSGIYFYTLSSGSYTDTKKMVLVK